MEMRTTATGRSAKSWTSSQASQMFRRHSVTAQMREATSRSRWPVSEQDTRSIRERQRVAIDRGSCSIQPFEPRGRWFILEHSDRRGPTVSAPLTRVTHSFETSTYVLAITRAPRYAPCDCATHHVPIAHRDRCARPVDGSALGLFESTEPVVQSRSCAARLDSTSDDDVDPSANQGCPSGGTARLAAPPPF